MSESLLSQMPTKRAVIAWTLCILMMHPTFAHMQDGCERWPKILDNHLRKIEPKMEVLWRSMDQGTLLDPVNEKNIVYVLKQVDYMLQDQEEFLDCFYPSNQAP